MAKIISVVDKPIADNVSDKAYFLGIQDNGEGKQALCRLPYDKVCRQLNTLTDEDIQAVKKAALGEVTEAAQNAQDVANDLVTRAENGEFNGKDYVITSDDIKKIAEQAAALAGAMQGGTVTYKIPKKYYQTDFRYDPDPTSHLHTISISFGEVYIDFKQFNEDLEAGIVELPDGNLLNMEREKLEKYISFDIKPWAPTPREPWIDLASKGTFEIRGNLIGGVGQFTTFLNKIWNNDFKVSIHAENSKGETAYACIKSDTVYSANTVDIGMIPFFGIIDDFDEETEIQTTKLVLMAMGAPIGYGSGFGEYTSYVTDDDVKEITITFTPNNAYVEEYDNEESF